MSFLTGEWRKLAMINYTIDPTILEEYVPFGTELDIWKGQCFVSVIGFMFLNTKLLGIPVPFHKNFEEVNLRFYVKRFDDGVWKRGVVFVKEIVPKYTLAWVANTVYKENYEALPMRHKWETKSDHQNIEYSWKTGTKWNSILFKAGLNKVEIEEGSKSEFITEHYWGYAKVNERTTNEYEVTHPKWNAYPVLDSKIDIDFESVYGNQFKFLQDCTPDSLILAEGSHITVEPKKRIK